MGRLSERGKNNVGILLTPHPSPCPIPPPVFLDGGVAALGMGVFRLAATSPQRIINDIPLFSTNQRFFIVMLDPTLPYVLLLLDIKGSTRLPPREAESAKNTLDKILKKWNRKLKPARSLRINYGDEIAGLFKSPRGIFDAVDDIRQALHPHEFRFVVTKGLIGTADRDLRKVGGPVFKDANEQLDRIKKARRFCHWNLGDRTRDAMITSLCETAYALMLQMTSYQREVYQLLEQEMPQVQIAEKLGKLPQSVSDAVARGAADLVIDAHRAIRTAVNEIY